MMVEVLVASLLTLTFTIVAMQIFVMGTAVKVRAQETSEITNWVEQDLEDVKNEANRMDYCESGSTSTSCTGISNAYATDSAKCTATASSNGYANSLKAIRDTANISKSSALGNRPYTLRRETTVNSTAPYNVLQINYTVFRGTTTGTAAPTGTSVYRFYSEIVPGVSFSCRTLFPT
jgi:hypothetical protein